MIPSMIELAFHTASNFHGAQFRGFRGFDFDSKMYARGTLSVHEFCGREKAVIHLLFITCNLVLMVGLYRVKHNL